MPEPSAPAVRRRVPLKRARAAAATRPMDTLPLLFGLIFVGMGAVELWVAVSLPRLLPALRARAASARGAGKGDAGAAHAPNAFELLEANPRAMLVVRLAIAVSALFSIGFGWRFATGG